MIFKKKNIFEIIVISHSCVKIVPGAGDSLVNISLKY